LPKRKANKKQGDDIEDSFWKFWLDKKDLRRSSLGRFFGIEISGISFRIDFIEI
jgi:hypothetical protein